MKIGTKLVIGFLVLASFIIIPVLINWTMMEQISKYETAHHIAHKLSTNIYLEQGAINAYVTEPSVEEAEYAKHYNESLNAITNLNPLLETNEEKALLTAISTKHDELKNLFNEIKQQTDRERNLPQLIYDKAIEVRDKRREFRDNYLRNVTYKDVLVSPITYTFKDKQYNHTIKYGYNNIQFHEKMYMWEYRAEYHDTWLDAVNEFETIIEASQLSQTDKNNINKIFSEYKDMAERLVGLHDPNDLVFLGLQKYKLSEEIAAKRDYIKLGFLEKPAYADIVDTGIVYTFKGKEKKDTISSIFNLMAHYDREYIWQYMDKKHYDEWLESVEDFSTIIGTSTISQTDKDKIDTLVEEYIGLTNTAQKILDQINNATFDIKTKKTNQIATINKKVQEIQTGTSNTDKEGLDYLITLRRAEISRQMSMFIRTSLIVGLVAILIAISLSAFISHTISKPINKLTKAIEDISIGKLDTEIEPKLKESKDEIGRLAQAFDRTIVSLKLAVKKGKKKQ